MLLIKFYRFSLIESTLAYVMVFQTVVGVILLVCQPLFTGMRP